MTNNAQRLTRNDLYDLVWSEPVTKIVARYSITDSGLAKICKRMEIPKPPRGYWAKISAGVKLKKTPLPKASAECELVVTLPLESTDRALVDDFETKPENKIIVPERINKFHPLVIQTREVIEKFELKKDEIFSTRHADSLTIRISKALLPRACRILHTIIEEAKKRLFKVAIDHEHWSGKYRSYIEVSGHKIYFLMEEETKRHTHVPTDNEIKYGWMLYKYDYKSTGALVLRIDEYNRGVSKRFADNKFGMVENKLNQFFASVKQIAVIEEKRRLESEENERLWELRRREEEEVERLKQEKLAKIRKLEQDAEKFIKARYIREYLEALKIRTDTMPEHIAQQIEFAEEYLKEVGF